MMLRGLVSEVVTRRLWPIALVAILIAIAAPLLFMRSAPTNVPAATAAPPAAAPGNLPGHAERLVATSDGAVTSRRRSQRERQDPFAPPASVAKAAEGAAAAAAPASPGRPATPSSGGGSAPPVNTGSDGSKLTISTQKKKPKADGAKPTPAKPAPDPAPQTTPVQNVALVDVRFGERKDSALRRGVPRLQTFRAADRVAAVFVKYSPARDKAVFAIAPSTRVSGDVECRRKQGVCRYVDVPAGKHVRLRMRTEGGSFVSRRLDVVRIRRMTEKAAATPEMAVADRVTPLAEATCLLQGLLKLPAIVPSISVDACE